MKTQELIKQAEELLSKCSEGPWKGKLTSGLIDSQSGLVWDHWEELKPIKNSNDFDFIVFARNNMPALLDRLKRYEEALQEVVALSNVLIASHADGSETIELSEAGEVAKKALEDE